MIFQNIYMNTISPLRNRSYLGRIKKICMDLRLGIPVLFVALLLNKLFVKLVELYLASTVLKYKKAIMAKENYIKDLLFDLGEDLSTAVTTYMSKMLTEENSTLKEKIKNTEASLTATNKDNENKNVQIVAYKSFANNLGEFSWCGDCMSCIAYCQPLFINNVYSSTSKIIEKLSFKIGEISTKSDTRKIDQQILDKSLSKSGKQSIISKVDEDSRPLSHKNNAQSPNLLYPISYKCKKNCVGRYLQHYQHERDILSSRLAHPSSLSLPLPLTPPEPLSTSNKLMEEVQYSPMSDRNDRMK